MDIYPERHVVYGVAYEVPELDVHCGTCKAAVGVPCAKARGGSHTTRFDKAANRRLRKTAQLHSQLENKALRAEPKGPLWTFTTQAHVCSIHGPHVSTECG